MIEQSRYIVFFTQTNTQLLFMAKNAVFIYTSLHGIHHVCVKREKNEMLKNKR